ncbi:hypothetical protein [Francisella sp. LA112445]|uniref:hypothetical protein n=1 Tax=Francisella sp. LA112445 TaxID=1395624 RepID=UPI001788CBA4|nr:hypothetical protein [Francisella sp. LA112445]QIW10789.1 hypothetical protein FIP56_08805 [Francisella sp. LA112445]
MKKLKIVLTTMALATPVVSLATDYAALEKELKTAESSSQSNYCGDAAAMQGGFAQKQQNIGRSIYNQNRGISGGQQNYGADQANNISTTDFGGQQKQQNIGRSIYDQNRGISQRQQRNNIKTTYFGDQQSQQDSSRSRYDQNRMGYQSQQYNRDRGNNIATSEFKSQQSNLSRSSSNPGENLFEQNQ